MHSSVFSVFDAICRAHGAKGAVLEVGAVPAIDTLLMLPALAEARERIGINLQEPAEFAGCRILQVDAHDMRPFEAGRFDMVLCNSMLEHDGRFWLSLSEMQRVVKPGGLIVIGVPGYAVPSTGTWRHLMRRLADIPFLNGRWGGAIEAYLAGTPVLGIHNYPGDYYRFSEQACREILMAGLEKVEIHRVLEPPRFIAAGHRSMSGDHRVPATLSSSANQLGSQRAIE
jgi:SAM-dependent methyltransferase